MKLWVFASHLFWPCSFPVFHEEYWKECLNLKSIQMLLNRLPLDWEIQKCLLSPIEGALMCSCVESWCLESAARHWFSETGVVTYSLNIHSVDTVVRIILKSKRVLEISMCLFLSYITKNSIKNFKYILMHNFWSKYSSVLVINVE